MTEEEKITPDEYLKQLRKTNVSGLFSEHEIIAYGMLCRYEVEAEYQSQVKEKEGKLPNSEDVKRWFQLLVGIGEEKMKEDIEKTLNK